MVQFDSDLIISKLRQCRSEADVVAFMEKASRGVRGIVQIERATFAVMGWEYRVDTIDVIKHEVDNLQIASRLGVKCAPLLHSELSFDDGNALLVTCVKGCAYRAPVSLSENFPRLSTVASQQLVSDIEQLASNGYYHKSAMSGFMDWYLNPDDQHIVFRRWDSLRPIVEREVQRWRITLQSIFDSYEMARTRQGELS